MNPASGKIFNVSEPLSSQGWATRQSQERSRSACVHDESTLRSSVRGTACMPGPSPSPLVSFSSAVEGKNRVRWARATSLLPPTPPPASFALCRAFESTNKTTPPILGAPHTFSDEFLGISFYCELATCRDHAPCGLEGNKINDSNFALDPPNSRLPPADAFRGAPPARILLGGSS